jgi:hypothetical protein
MGLRLPEGFGLSFTQAEVDFVIPDLEEDLPLCIDPFLLYKSKDPRLRKLHSQLLGIFDAGIKAYQEGQKRELDRLIDFPEVDEIGFGYSEGRIGGRGLGVELNAALADTLAASGTLQERGLRHVEELQLVAIGVGPDRVSDIAANAVKSNLIEYTQQQALLWNIPLTPALPIHHYFDCEEFDWTDGYFDLPLNPVSGLPVLLVPRRIVRLLPWINYDDYLTTEFRTFLNPRPSGPRLPAGSTRRKPPPKPDVISLTRGHLDLLDRYIGRKEREADNAGPALGPDHVSVDAEHRAGEDLLLRLDIDRLPTGQAAAAVYQHLVLEILNFLFEPELSDGRLEEKTFLGTERRDILYWNEANHSFWEYVRETYESPLVMFEIKNVGALELDHVNQTAAYLGANLGMLGLIVTRRPPGQNTIWKTYAVYNNSTGTPRKVILILSDEDLRTMIHMKLAGKNPTAHVQNIYRRFRTSVQ